MHVTGTLTRAISPARVVALETLEKVAGGAYASDTLRELSAGLSSRDAGLASQIVLGSMRFQGQLDYLIQHYSGRTVRQLDLPVQLALRTAIYQLRYLERVPVHAAVHEAVEFVKARARAAAGLTNAVLRKVARLPVLWPDLPTELSCPAWLIERWSAHFGEAAARAIAGAALQEPGRYIRIAPGSPLPELTDVQPTGVPGAYRLVSAVPPETRLHDISSQAIVPLLQLEAGNSYLDLCAAPGNKTVQALETPLALAVACDISPKRISDIPPVCPRVVLDASEPLPFGSRFDRIFIDAPCSGTGTLARNPEIKWRTRPEDLSRFSGKQFSILSQAITLMAPQGKLLYATCSLEREENEDIIERALETHRRLRCTREMWRLPGRDEGDGFYAAVLENVVE